jgi:hypothetical protein
MGGQPGERPAGGQRPDRGAMGADGEPPVGGGEPSQLPEGGGQSGQAPAEGDAAAQPSVASGGDAGTAQSQ